MARTKTFRNAKTMVDNANDDYFALRRVPADAYREYRLPGYLRTRLPRDKHAVIVDYGCGFGQVMREVRKLGYENVIGIDVSQSAIEQCRGDGLEVIDNSSDDALEHLSGKVDFLIVSHVVEHFPKSEIISKLKSMRSLLSGGGRLLIAVPNAQAFTGCYWAYEDFTHEYLFTAGSLMFVLRAAGFSEIEIIDKDCLEGASVGKKIVRMCFLPIYRANYWFWKKITAGATHEQSPDVFSYEIKALAHGGSAR